MSFRDGGESPFMRNKIAKEVSWEYELGVNWNGASSSSFKRVRRYGVLGSLKPDSMC